MFSPGCDHPNGFFPNGKGGQNLAGPRIDDHDIIRFRVPDIDSRPDGISPNPVWFLSYVNLFPNGQCRGSGTDHDHFINAGDGDISIGAGDSLQRKRDLLRSWTDLDRFAGADGNGNGLVDMADYYVWKGNFGQVGGGGGSALGRGPGWLHGARRGRRLEGNEAGGRL